MSDTIDQPSAWEIVLGMYNYSADDRVDVETHQSHHDGEQEAVIVVGEQIAVVAQATDEDGSRGPGYAWTAYATAPEGEGDTSELRGLRGHEWVDAGTSDYAATADELREQIAAWVERAAAPA